MKIRENIPLSELTTMRLGGPARYVIDIENESEIPDAYAFAKEHHLPTFILGAGANTIAKDEGFNGIILRYIETGITSEQLTGLEGDPQNICESKFLGEKKTRQDPLYMITAKAGEPWDNVVAYACDKDLTGIEALSKIPGLSGSAPVQNIGAYGQDISAVLDHATAYDTTTEKIVTLSRSDFGFSYRKSILNSTAKGRYLITSITLKLKKDTMSRPFYNSIEQYITDHHETDFSPAGIRKIVSIIRADKLPDPATTPSAGSFFKNIYLTAEEAKKAEEKGLPVHHGHDGNKINSGWLIENAGLKGKLLHGIRVNAKAALVLINESAKTYQDLAEARTEIISTVKSKYGFTLEQEPMEIPQ